MNRYLLNIDNRALPSLMSVFNEDLLGVFDGLSENLGLLAEDQAHGYPCDIYEEVDGSGNPDRMIIELCVAGISPDLIKVKFDQEDSNKLTVEIEKNEDSSQKNKRYFSKKISRKREKRTFLLSETCDASNILAETKEGMLKVTIPYKKEIVKIPVRDIKLITG